MKGDTYQPCAYLVEGVDPAALLPDTMAFQHSLALGLQRLTPAAEVGHLEDWLLRCFRLRLRPVLLLSSYDSSLAERFRSYCERHDGNNVEWMVWPPAPEEMLRLIRDPDIEVVKAMTSADRRLDDPIDADEPPRLRAIWHTPLTERLGGWINDFGDLLPGMGLDDEACRERAVREAERRWQGAQRVVHERRLPAGLAAADDRHSEAVKLDVGTWTISREEITNDPANQFLIFRCGPDVVTEFAGRMVEVDIGQDRFELGQIDERGTAEMLIPCGLNVSLQIDVRIIDG